MLKRLRVSLKRRGVALFALCLAATGVGVAVAPPAADALACSSGFFCYYTYTNLQDTRCLQYYYTTGYVEMTCGVDDGESSIEKQYADGCDYDAEGDPWVYLRDNYFSTNWSFSAAWNLNDTWNTFNPVPIAEGGSQNMNNRFNRIWNLCV